ncbi:MAG: metallophosphoesterase [Lachnospiraceae bacterium]|nr:metallophosphoesterase [Lachnospiraceae bacterium]
MKKRSAFLFCFLILFVFSAGGCLKADEALPVLTEEVRVTIPGMKGEVTLLWLSDLHMVVPGESADPACADSISARSAYSSWEGQTAEAQWNGWVDAVNAADADAVIFGGDILDLCSREGTESLKNGFGRLNKPFLYLRADHDLLPTYLSGVDEGMCAGWQSALCENADVMSMEFDDFIVVGWNNSTSNVSDAGLERFRELAESGKPLILLTHVPIEPLSDDSLAAASEAAYDGRSLIWGYRNAAYWPEENTRKLLDLLYAEDSPFVAVFCGHLHLSWDGQLTDRVREHVFPAAFSRQMGVIRVGG